MPLNHPSFCPIYEEVERQQLVMAVHTGFGSTTISSMFEGLPPLPGERPFIPPRGTGLVSGLLIQYAFSSLALGGLFEDFPRLRWLFLEVGSEWLVAATRFNNRRCPRDCRAYIEDGRVFASCEPDEDLPYLRSQFGEDWLVVASDMPHSDDFHHDSPEEAFRERGDLSEDFLDKLFQRNAAGLYGI